MESKAKASGPDEVNDHALFIRQNGSSLILLLVYVDDVILASNDIKDLEALKVKLNDKFKLTNLGELRFFLRLEIARKIIGKLQYLTIIRLDLAYSINKLSQFLASHKAKHLNAAQRVLQYVKGTPGQGLFYSVKSEIKIEAYTDADWASCIDTRRSTGGFCVFLENFVVSWKSKKQHIVFRSSAEAEYRAMANTTCEVCLLSLLDELGIEHHGPAILHCDNKAAQQ
uniref:Reverse transcriptase Ty1/copia-type domain-containing protein n=1 Tax=Cannabis sativa TaxID=3483 RepID=A0A803Q1I1_CANSA